MLASSSFSLSVTSVSPSPSPALPPPTCPAWLHCAASFPRPGSARVNGAHLSSQENAAVALNSDQRYADVVNRAREKVGPILIVLAKYQICFKQLLKNPIAIEPQMGRTSILTKPELCNGGLQNSCRGG